MKRILSWDRYRGLAILLMAVVNDLATSSGIPAFLKHAPGVGYTLADVVAPMFIFAMGLTFMASFQKRYAINKLDAYLSMIKRNLAFIGLGAIFSGVGVYFVQEADWGVLQALGVSGLICLAVIRLKPAWRTFIAIALLAIYQCSITFWFSEQVLTHLHGGVLGAISWGAMLILATVLLELYSNQKLYMAYAVFLLALGGLALSPIAPISKHLVSASYILISLALCGTIFWAVDAIGRWFHLEERQDFLCVWGENPLVLYLAHYVLIGIFHFPNFWFEPPVWLSLIRTLVMLILLNTLANFLQRKQVHFSF
jgi:predicted acyltransferase